MMVTDTGIATLVTNSRCHQHQCGPRISSEVKMRPDQMNGHWLVSNFIPMDSTKFEFRDFDSIIRFVIKNESEIEKLRSRDFPENSILRN